MESGQHSAIVNFIWGIADDILRDVYVRGKYRDVILPMTVIRRLDHLLEPTKDAVLAKKKFLDEIGVLDQEQALCAETGLEFYNASPFTLKSIHEGNPTQFDANLIDYLNGFSNNVREILEKFDFQRHVKKLSQSDVLGDLLEKYLSPSINLSPNPTVDDLGNALEPGLSNHSMGYVFEELIRKFNEDNNEEAGEHFTPREVVHLMARLVMQPVAQTITDGHYYVYDCACGTGGMLTEAEHTLISMANANRKKVAITLFGQEVNAETYAICKADLLIQGEDESHIAFGSTLSEDAFADQHFDFMLANPPYGKSWKTEQRKLGGKDIIDPRFVIQFADDPEYKMLPRSSDGQLLFLINMLSKMKDPNAVGSIGSRVATIHNGSSLFTGDAGSGESNIRRWIIENDWLEAIIGLPENLFYNTGIATYIWVLTNNKPAHRRGFVQLIDAREHYSKMRRNLGQKNCELSEEDINTILHTFETTPESDTSKLIPNAALGYWKVTVERPLRLKLDLSPQSIDTFAEQLDDKHADLLATLKTTANDIGPGPHMDWNTVLPKLKATHKAAGHKWTKTLEKQLLTAPLLTAAPDAEPVIKKRHKSGQIDYDNDANLRDTEQIPLDTDGGIDGYMAREVTPHVPDAWVDHTKTKIGYEIPFTRYFYTYTPPRPLNVIEAEILALESDIQVLMKEVLG